MLNYYFKFSARQPGILQFSLCRRHLLRDSARYALFSVHPVGSHLSAHVIIQSPVGVVSQHFLQIKAASPCWTIRGVRVLQEGTIRSKFSCGTGLLHSAAMKFSIIAAVVVLALAQGSFAQDIADLERLGQYFEEMKNKITLELTEIIRNQEVATQAQAFIEDKKTQLEPLAVQVQDQLKVVATSVKEQFQPMAVDVQAQIQPMVEKFQSQVQAIFQALTEQTKAIGQ